MNVKQDFMNIGLIDADGRNFPNFALTGCGNKNDRESVSGTNTLETVEYNGHRYIMYQGVNKGRQ